MSDDLSAHQPTPDPQLARKRNQDAWNRLVRTGNRFARPAREEDLNDPLSVVDARGWLGSSVHGKQVLCLAAGGGKQSAIYAAAGALVTVVDLSEEMLKLDEQVAREKAFPITPVHASMDDLSCLADRQFDIVIHPVSTCYLPNLMDVYREVARVIRAEGIYISQHKQPTSLQASLRCNSLGQYEIQQSYYRRTRLPVADTETPLREEGTFEYIHRWEDLIGGLCRHGFVIEDLVEPFHAEQNAGPGEFGHRADYIAPYVRIKARRVTSALDATPKIIIA